MASPGRRSRSFADVFSAKGRSIPVLSSPPGSRNRDADTGPGRNSPTRTPTPSPLRPAEAHLALLPRQEPADVGVVLGHDERRHQQVEAGRVAVAEQPGDERGEGGGQDGSQGDVAGECHDRNEADQQDGEDGGREAQDDAGGGRDTLAALEAEPEGEEVAEDGAGTRRHGTGGPEPVEGGEGRDRTLEEVEQQGGEGQALAAGAQDVGGADVAGADGADVPQPRPAGEDEAERHRADQVADEDAQQQRPGGRAARRLDHQGLSSSALTGSGAVPVSMVGHAWT